MTVITYSQNFNDWSFLFILDRNKSLMTWHDGDIRPGEEWNDAIQSALKEADIVLLLVSADFLATNYIHEIELELAEKQRELGKASIVPIIVRPCLWEKTDFAKYNALPLKGKAVSTWTDKDEAWLEVVEGIEGLL